MTTGVEKNGHNFVQIDGTYLCAWCGCVTGVPEALEQCRKFPDGPPRTPTPTEAKVVELFDARRNARKR